MNEKCWCRLLDILIPKRRCAHGEHNFRKRFRRGYFPDCHHGATQERLECVHCRTPQGEWETVYSTRYTSISMPSDMFETLDREGELWTEEGWRND